MFDNKKVAKTGIHYTRYIASWRNVGGRFFDEEFEEWLMDEGCNETEIMEIRELAKCGKMELEHNASKYVNKEMEVIKKYESETAKQANGWIKEILNKIKKGVIK